jgi:Fic family protein
MINPETPYNDLPKLPPEVNFRTVEILELALEANKAMGRLEGKTSNAFRSFNNAMTLARTFTVREAVDSSAVEDIHTTVRDVLESRALDVDDLTSEQKETSGYLDAMITGLKELKDKGFLNTNSFIGLQKELVLPYYGIRQHPGYVIANKVTSEIYYTPPEGEKVIRNLLKDFEDYFNDESNEIDALIKMAVLHYQFEAIHPFTDGNGRIGRILMALYLVKRDVLSYPVLFLSDYILNHRTEYYRALREVTYQGKWIEWVTFILTAVKEQAVKTMQALEEIDDIRLDFEKKLPKSIPAARHHLMIDFVFTNAAFSKEQFATGLDIHPNTASSYLKSLKKVHLIDSVRKKNRLIFFVPEFINIFKK